MGFINNFHFLFLTCNSTHRTRDMTTCVRVLAETMAVPARGKNGDTKRILRYRFKSKTVLRVELSTELYLKPRFIINRDTRFIGNRIRYCYMLYKYPIHVFNYLWLSCYVECILLLANYRTGLLQKNYSFPKYDLFKSIKLTNMIDIWK